MKVTMEMNQVLTEWSDLLNSIWNNSSGQDFLEFKLTAIYCNRRGSVGTTPQMTCFPDAKVCSKLLQERSDDQIIQPDNKFTTGLKVRIQNWL